MNNPIPDDADTLKDSLPPDLRAWIGNGAWEEILVGWSGMRVFRIQGGDILKIAHPPHDLTPEHNRLTWLAGRLPVPAVRFFADQGTQQVLLMSEIPGLPSHFDAFETQRARIITLLAEGLRQIHAVDIADCPFDMRAAIMIDMARDRMERGLVSEDGWDRAIAGEDRTAPDLFAEVVATRPTVEDVVFTHGDYCLPNVLVDPVSVTLTGFVDWGHGGLADRCVDLALCARSITYNFSADWVAPFLEAYGLAEIDQAKFTFYRRLDEFF